MSVVAVLAVLAVLAVATALVAWCYRSEALKQEAQARSARQQANGRRSATDVMAMLDKTQRGGDLAAMRLALAGHRVAPHVKLFSAMQAALFRQRAALAWDRRGPVSRFAISPESQPIVSGGYDGTVRMWDAMSGQSIGQPLKGHEGAVVSVAISADGQRIVSGSEDGTVRSWPAPAAWASLLCAKLTRNFSQKDWDQYVGKDIAYALQCPGLPKPAD